MSRFAKSSDYNSLKDARVGSLSLPTGTTAQRDPAPLAGEIRWNTTNSRLEFYNGSSYNEVATRGNVTITKDSFTGDDVTTAFVLSITPTSVNNILVFVGNVYQESTVNYTLTGATITFTSAPPTATNIVVLHGFDSTGNTSTPPFGNNTLELRDEGSPILIAAGALNFIGSGVEVTDAGGGVANITITGGGGGSALTVQDEGTSLSTAVTKINFVGAGVTVTEPVTDEMLVTIDGGGGSGHFFLKHRITGGAAGGVIQALLGSYNVRVGGGNHSTVMSTLGNRMYGSYQGQSGGTMGTLANYANSANPTAAVPTNTTAALGVGLGGQFWETASAAVNTDLIICSYQVPAASATFSGRRLVIRGVSLMSFVQAAITGGPLVAQYSLAFGHTAVSLATSEAATTKAARRVALPAFTQAQVVTQAANTIISQPGGSFVDFGDAPIYVNPGEFVALVKKKIGTADTVGTVAHVVSFIYGWE